MRRRMEGSCATAILLAVLLMQAVVLAPDIRGSLPEQR